MYYSKLHTKSIKISASPICFSGDLNQAADIKLIDLTTLEGETTLVDADCWQVFLFTKAGGSIKTEVKEEVIREHSVLLVTPNTISDLNLFGPVTGIRIKFMEENSCIGQENAGLLMKLSDHLLYNDLSIIDFSFEEFTVLQDIALHLEAELYALEPDTRVIIQSYFNIFLRKLAKGITPIVFEVGPTASLGLVISFRQCVEKNILKYNKIQDYVRLLGVNAKKISAACKLHTGLSPSDYLHKRQLIAAKRMLLHSKMCLKEIAYKLNFTDLSHFNKFFKQKVGVSPRQFLQRNSNILKSTAKKAFS